ncbi:MAG: hypothetical protein V4677_16145 [Bacteroidota bacterium]
MDIRKLPLRLILSVVAGIAVTMALSIVTRHILYLAGIFPKIGEPEFETDLLIIALVYHSVYAVIGAVVTSHIAREKAKKASFMLGTKEVIMWILGTLLLWKHAAPWYNLSKALLGIPLAMLGWKLYELYKKYKEQSKKEDMNEQKKTMIRHHFKRLSSIHHKVIKPKQI